jgi:hypothetical protein
MARSRSTPPLAKSKIPLLALKVPIAGTNTCACTNDSDCAKSEDGNLCNGTLYCDKSVAGAFECKVNPQRQRSWPRRGGGAAERRHRREQIAAISDQAPVDRRPERDGPALSLA